ncbi:glycosyltransferase [Sphingomonas sp. RT2P30]|uniref:glycosyltransferase n=1 Tax=Parasphingomonas halimpatiens TaxID=3096162 RepID=UPI002FCB03E6
MTHDPSTALPSVSIVINTLNRADLLDDAIRGVFQLDYPSFELIVVNGPSTDRTEEVLARWSDRIKHLRCDVPNLSVSRNVGIAAAAGDIVAFLDDDAVPHPKWLKKLAPHYQNPRLGGVGGFTVDNTGVRWQVRKTICDRLGNAHFVNAIFDEGTLNFPGTPAYPSLLGTNSSFRRAALLEIRGFDHVFAYLLDETDVCLRLVDAGWHIKYEPSALIFHQFAESHVRSPSRKPRTLYPSVVSKTYFVNRHGQQTGQTTIARALEDYREELFRANKWLADHGDISHSHRTSLDLDVEVGTETGLAASHKALSEGKRHGDLSLDRDPGRLLKLSGTDDLRIALVSQGIPPANDAGIARWTALVAQGLRDLGIKVHVISRATALPSRRFRDGIWHHAIAADVEGGPAIAAHYGLPASGVGEWIAGVMREIDFIKTFGLDLVSFPIWDLEALPVLDDPSLATILSLHTSYLLARPFKPEWNARVIYGRSFIDKMIAAEKGALERAPAILANSHTVTREIEKAYGVDIAARCETVPHGTPDILADCGISLDEKRARSRQRGGLRVLVPGRMEIRKGYDLSLKVAAAMFDAADVNFDFVGQRVDGEIATKAEAESGVEIGKLKNATFHGLVSRERLDELFADSDIVLVPSRFESFGLVAIEAMSAGAPVLAMAAGALPEVVDDLVSGRLIPENADFVAAACDILLGLARDPAALDRLSQSTHTRYQEKYSVSVMAARLAQIYRDAVAARKVQA